MEASCTPSTFDPSIFGAEVLALNATPVTGYQADVIEGIRYVQPAVQVEDASFCNVTVTYTHPGQGDSIVVEVWLPHEEEWNGRLLATGGSGWAAGRYEQALVAMAGSVYEGYATATSDAGLGDAQEPSPWAMSSPGNVNLYNLQNLASVAMNDMSLFAKAVIADYYGAGPEYSYYNGCSQGGRQGLMLAQRYPEAFDGIAANAPGVYWTEAIPQLVWPQQVMRRLGVYPRECEMEAITLAALDACDDLDGVKDGIIGYPDRCLGVFDASSQVGEPVEACAQANNQTVEVTEEAATVVNATWKGMADENGKVVFPGLDVGADITNNGLLSWRSWWEVFGTAETECDPEGNGTCWGVPYPIGPHWSRYFVARDEDFDDTNLTARQWDQHVHSSTQQWDSVMGSGDPDLRAFRDAGGKMVTFHGLIDNCLPSGAMERYYTSVEGVTPDVHDFYRYFEAPGLAHCAGGASGNPDGLLDQLRAWVENGTAPDQTPIEVTTQDEETHQRILCPYPQRAKFESDCGDPADADCWVCAEYSRD